MAEGRRPGGLTALAVLNFVIGGFSVLGVLAKVALIAAFSVAADRIQDGGGTTSYTGPSLMAIYLAIALSAVAAALIITSGVGYLQQKRFLGRSMGNAYAAVSIAGSIVDVVLVKLGFGIGAIILLVYPILTLVLVNGAFKDDLVN